MKRKAKLTRGEQEQSRNLGTRSMKSFMFSLKIGIWIRIELK